jgi:hypothetical protein
MGLEEICAYIKTIKRSTTIEQETWVLRTHLVWGNRG